MNIVKKKFVVTGSTSDAGRVVVAKLLAAGHQVTAVSRAADILQGPSFTQPRVRELLGPRDYTMKEATEILGAAIGKPDLAYAQSSYEDSLKGMITAGLSPSFADAVMDTARSFNKPQRWALEERSAQNTTPTKLEDFARELFRDRSWSRKLRCS
jgi:uncharacterized protein YbjT (DUF2867 family)